MNRKQERKRKLEEIKRQRRTPEAVALDLALGGSFFNRRRIINSRKGYTRKGRKREIE